jgi:hypothetical protein
VATAAEGTQRFTLRSMNLVLPPFFPVARTHKHGNVSHCCVTAHPCDLIRNSSNHTVELLTRLAIAAKELVNVFVRTNIVRVLAGDMALDVKTINQPPPL